MNTKSNTSSTIAAMRSCIDTLSETASMTPPLSIVLPHEGSSSGKILSLNIQIVEIKMNI
jgi:hypothetical protein